ncbi:hypothetical protein ABIC94_001274 [Variovorax paradoxus]|uniref:ankyrin repeat domain-containing protein n=1 Tax=Variovorax paradoxus TaxID=34073 RepID=UPI0033977230
MKWLLTGVFSLAAAVCSAAPIERCPEPAEAPDYGDFSAEAFQRAFKEVPPIAYGLGKDRRRQLATLLARGEDPNACVGGVSVLAVSAVSGELEEVRMLLDGGAGVDRPMDTGGSTPLLTALGMGRYESAELLLARGADTRHAADGGFTALHQLAQAPLPVKDGEHARAQQIAWVERLLNAGLAVDVRDSRGNTPLLLATGLRNRELTAYLLQRGADPGARNDRGNSPFEIARKRGDAGWLDMFERAKPVDRPRQAPS